MTPLLCPVWWAATRASFSSTSTRREGARRTSSRAVARPRIPAPTTTTSNRRLRIRNALCSCPRELREARHELLHALFGKRDGDLLVVVAYRARHDDPLPERGVAHLVPGAKARLARDGAALALGPAGPFVGQSREHRVAARGLALLVPRAVPLPVELGPRVTLLQLH